MVYDISQIAVKKQMSQSSFFSKFPTFDMGDLVLRDLALSDSENYYKLMNDPLVAQFVHEADIPASTERAKEEIKFWSGLFYKKQSIFWGIADKTSNELIGTIGFNNWSFANHRAEIAYDLLSRYWRRGIMSRALETVLQFAFDTMQLNRVEAKTMLNNTGSVKILEKFGFKLEGILHQYRKVRGEYIDVYLYSLVQNHSGH